MGKTQKCTRTYALNLRVQCDLDYQANKKFLACGTLSCDDYLCQILKSNQAGPVSNMYHYSLQANLNADCDLVLLRASDMVLARNISCCHDYYLCYKISIFHQTEQNYGSDTHLDFRPSDIILACDTSSCLDNHPVCQINLNSHNAGQSYGPEHEHVALKPMNEVKMGPMTLIFELAARFLYMTYCRFRIIICATQFSNSTMQDEAMVRTRYWNTLHPPQNTHTHTHARIHTHTQG